MSKSDLEEYYKKEAENDQRVAKMEEIAVRYAHQLDSNFRRLNIFVSHPGEIGKAHEVVLRDILKRFLPKKYYVGTGFYINPTGESKQQDILIYNQYDYPTLFEVGDCVVVDWKAVRACIEVKTKLGWKSIREGIDKSDRSAIFAWEGIELATLKSRVKEYLRDHPNNYDRIPLIYVRSKYIWYPACDENNNRAFFYHEIKEEDSSAFRNGHALLFLLDRLWSGLQEDLARPDWLRKWIDYNKSKAKIFLV